MATAAARLQFGLYDLDQSQRDVQGNKKGTGHVGIQDKVILISGASSGTGEATARILASKGARVVLGARYTDRLLKLVLRSRVDW